MCEKSTVVAPFLHSYFFCAIVCVCFCLLLPFLEVFLVLTRYHLCTVHLLTHTSKHNNGMSFEVRKTNERKYRTQKEKESDFFPPCHLLLVPTRRDFANKRVGKVVGLKKMGKTTLEKSKWSGGSELVLPLISDIPLTVLNDKYDTPVCVVPKRGSFG